MAAPGAGERRCPSPSRLASPTMSPPLTAASWGWRCLPINAARGSTVAADAASPARFPASATPNAAAAALPAADPLCSGDLHHRGHARFQTAASTLPAPDLWANRAAEGPLPPPHKSLPAVGTPGLRAVGGSRSARLRPPPRLSSGRLQPPPLATPTRGRPGCSIRPQIGLPSCASLHGSFPCACPTARLKNREQRWC